MTSERRGSFGASVIDRCRTRAYWAWLRAGKTFQRMNIQRHLSERSWNNTWISPTEPVQNSFWELMWRSDLRLERERESAHVRNYKNNLYKAIWFPWCRKHGILESSHKNGICCTKLQHLDDEIKSRAVHLIKWRYRLVSVKIKPQNDYLNLDSLQQNYCKIL